MFGDKEIQERYSLERQFPFGGEGAHVLPLSI
jgi:hypothetical protein